MKKTKYTAPAVEIIRIETFGLLTGSTLTVGIEDGTTSGDANSRGCGFDDFEDDDDLDDSFSQTRAGYAW